MKKQQWLVIAVMAVAVIAVIVGGVVAYRHQHPTTSMKSSDNMAAQAGTAGDSNYTLTMLSGTTYASNKPTTLRFTVKQDGAVFKHFAVDSTKLMHLIAVRKDRSNFQHLHPEYNSSTGVFTLNNFQFPTDGKYRLYANFVPTNAKKDSMGMEEAEAPYVDVAVGNTASVADQPLGADSLTSTADGLTATITNPPADDSPSVATMPTFYAGQDGTVTVEVTKNGSDFTKLQPYLSNLGHMVILGPNLEFIHAHPTVNDVNNQSGYVPFMVTFPVSGQYRIYLQMQADNTVSTFSFNLTVQDMPKPANGSSTGSMPGMDM